MNSPVHTYSICLPLHGWFSFPLVDFLGQWINAYITDLPGDYSILHSTNSVWKHLFPKETGIHVWSRTPPLLAMEIGLGPSWPIGGTDESFCGSMRTEKLSLPGNGSASRCKPPGSGAAMYRKPGQEWYQERCSGQRDRKDWILMDE